MFQSGRYCNPVLSPSGSQDLSTLQLWEVVCEGHVLGEEVGCCTQVENTQTRDSRDQAALTPQ